MQMRMEIPKRVEIIQMLFNKQVLELYYAIALVQARKLVPIV